MLALLSSVWTEGGAAMLVCPGFEGTTHTLRESGQVEKGHERPLAWSPRSRVSPGSTLSPLIAQMLTDNKHILVNYLHPG